MGASDPKPVEETFQYCPRCAAENSQVGSIPFRCPACDYADFFGPVSAVAALVINADNQLLLVRRARDPGKGKWGLPGGFVDRGETIEQAMAREVKEETTLQVVESQYLYSHPNDYEYRGIVIPTIDVFFVCQVAQPPRITLQASELEHYEWVRPTKEYLDNMAFHSNRLAIQQWLATSR